MQKFHLYIPVSGIFFQFASDFCVDKRIVCNYISLSTFGVNALLLKAKPVLFSAIQFL